MRYLITVGSLAICLAMGCGGNHQESTGTSESALAGGQGRAQGNACMAQCVGQVAAYYDSSKEITARCQAECNVGTGAGACSTSADGCCVPYTADPDCECAAGDAAQLRQQAANPDCRVIHLAAGTFDLSAGYSAENLAPPLSLSNVELIGASEGTTVTATASLFEGSTLLPPRSSTQYTPVIAAAGGSVSLRHLAIEVTRPCSTSADDCCVGDPDDPDCYVASKEIIATAVLSKGADKLEVTDCTITVSTDGVWDSHFAIDAFKPGVGDVTTLVVENTVTHGTVWVGYGYDALWPGDIPLHGLEFHAELRNSTINDVDGTSALFVVGGASSTRSTTTVISEGNTFNAAPWGIASVIVFGATDHGNALVLEPNTLEHNSADITSTGDTINGGFFGALLVGSAGHWEANSHATTWAGNSYERRVFANNNVTGSFSGTTYSGSTINMAAFGATHLFPAWFSNWGNGVVRAPNMELVEGTWEVGAGSVVRVEVDVEPLKLASCGSPNTLLEMVYDFPVLCYDGDSEDWPYEFDHGNKAEVVVSSW